jgi:lipoprotein-anchoring transpeptidase ErfK/SrfK
MLRSFRNLAGAALAVALLSGCVAGDDEPNEGQQTGQVAADAQTAPQPQAAPAVPAQPQPPAPPPMRLEVNLAERRLYVYRDGQQVATHPVAVGSEEWPTPTGEWTINQVIWNPRWIPPREEEWAKDEEEKEPGDPENPLGRAQLVYQAPNSIHGTNEPESLGKAVSHGSIRASNEVVLELARQITEAGGAGKDDAWYRQARENRTERQEVVVPNPIPIRVVAGSGSAQGSGS